MVEERIKLPWQPKQLGLIKFSSDFSPLEVSGEAVDADKASLILSTINRLSRSIGNFLRLGEMRIFSSWGGGRGLLYQNQRNQIQYELSDQVTCWEEVESSLEEDIEWKYYEQLIPFFSSFEEIVDYLNDMEMVTWFAVRKSISSSWKFNFKRNIADRKLIQQACNGAYRTIVIFSAQQLPRSRFCIGFENGKLWIWRDHRGDNLILLTKKASSNSQIQQVIQVGESFLLN